MTLSSSQTVPPPGEEARFPLPAAENHHLTIQSSNNSNKHWTVRHGSSLALMANVCEFLANPSDEDSFNTVDPTKDHHKWKRKGMDLYYACVVDETGKIMCALRAATENMGLPKNASGDTTTTCEEHEEKKRKRAEETRKASGTESTSSVSASIKPQRRFLIDYVYTAPDSRDLGIAGRLVTTVLEMASSPAHDAHCYVLSLEDSCVYWMEKHQFFLCQSPGLNGLLNVFPDTHLLRRRRQRPKVHQPVSNATTTNVSVSGNGGAEGNENDSDEEEAMVRYRLQQEQDSSDDSSQEGLASGNGDNKTPPESFTRALKDLLAKEEAELKSFSSNNSKPLPPRSEEMKTCLSTLAVLIQNAANDDTDDGKRRKCRINNPQVHRRVFSVGGDSAMSILQVCGFELQVDGDEGDVELHFHPQNVGGEHGSSWLDAAVARLQLEATK